MNDFVGYIDDSGIEFDGSFSYEGRVGPQGEQGIQGPAGADGYTPVKGTDYFTAADIAGIEADVITSVGATAGSTIDLSINASTYVMTLDLKNANGVTISTDSIDLPLESMVVSGSYDSVNKKVVLTLQSGSTVEFSVADLVSGLQTEITNANKLSADLVDDTSTTNKFVTAADKTTWNSKESASNKVTSIDSSSTNTQYPSAKLLHDQLQLKANATDFTGTDGVADGTAGLVPAPLTTDAGKFLKADGTWATAGSGAEEITDSTIQAWLLDEGFYRIKTNSFASFYYDSGHSDTIHNDCYLIVQNVEDTDGDLINYFYLFYPPESTIDSSQSSYNGETDLLVGWSVKKGNTVTGARKTVKLGNMQLKSNLVTTINGSSTDTKYPSAKCVYDNLATKTDSNNVVKSFWKGTQAQYDAILVKDATTLYLIEEA